MLMYIELKTGCNDRGPAWIGYVKTSKSGRTVYFNGKAFKQGGRGCYGNHYDLETGEMYWISGVKKRGSNRHWAGSGKITIEAAAVAEYLRLTGAHELDSTRFAISDEIEPANPSKFHDLENAGLEGCRRATGITEDL
jgi:hypothetical protein